MANWIKTTPYGDYRDPLQNHKFDGSLMFKEGVFLKPCNKLQNMFSEAKWFYKKHIGSKPLYKIKNTIIRANSVKFKLSSNNSTNGTEKK